MSDSGRNTLAAKTGVLVGSGFGRHPINPQRSVNVVIYKTDDQWVICLSEIDGCGDREGQRSALGQHVPGRLFAPYATRGIGAEMPYRRVQELVNKSVQEVEMHWLAETDLKVSET